MSRTGEQRRRAIVVGAGFGGLSMGIRLQSMGFDTTVVEALDKPGGRAYVREVDGYTFDMGPTVITVPHFIEELFRLEVGEPELDVADFPEDVLSPAPVTGGVSGGPHTSRYCTIRPLTPFYRINFDDGTWFDYDGDPQNTRRQIAAIDERDVEGYERFHAAAKAIFERGFLELGYTRFLTVGSMLAVVPDLLKLDAVRNLFRFSSKYFKSDKLRQVFSFETLLVGGNPMSVPAIYAMIHFVEKTWGVHYCMGGTGALVRGFVEKFEDLGGTMRLASPVDKILVTTRDGKPAGRFTSRVARGVLLESGERLDADLVVSNADYGTTMLKLLDPVVRPTAPDWVVKAKRYTMSLVVIYFGFVDEPELDHRLKHHNIILGPRYEALLEEIFGSKVLGRDFSQYLHVPTLTDPSMAPEGHHAAYTLVPVPHNGSGIDWETEGAPFVDRVLGFLEERGHIPELSRRLTHKSWITPDYFQTTLRSHLGNGFGLEPVLTQSAWFRPHNRVRDIEGLYLVGASSQPGAGTPSVMMSAKMTARCVAEDFPQVLGAARGPSEATVALVDEQAVVQQSRQVLAHHARTFNLASLFLSEAQRDDAAVVYALCRRVDDLVDESPDDVQGALEVGRMRSMLGGSVEPSHLVGAFLEVTRRTSIPLHVVHDLMDGVVSDVGEVTVRTDAELVRYAYGVAGTVGVMMCGVIGATQRWARPHAIDLGLAMQVTNICRDVLEDAGRGRVYLPASRLRAAGVEPEDLTDGSFDTARVGAVVRDLLDLADRYYRSAEQGMRAIPLRPRVAIYTAALVYRAIGLELRRRNCDVTRGRAVVPMWRKLGWVAVAVTKAVLCPLFPRRPHDATLHQGLRGYLDSRDSNRQAVAPPIACK